MDFRHDRRRRDRGAERVAVNDGELRPPDARDGDRIEQKRIRRRVERLDRELHRGQARTQDVARVDLAGFDHADSDCDGASTHTSLDALATLGVDAFGVVEAGNDAVVRKDDGRRDDGAREGAAPRLVDAGNPEITAAAELLFGTVEQRQAAELREEKGIGARGHSLESIARLEGVEC